MQGVGGMSPLPVGNISSFCWICLTNAPENQLRPCSHIFCSSCLTSISQLNDDEKNPISISDLNVNHSPISNFNCPLCRRSVNNVVKFQMPYKVLQDKYLNIFTNTMIGTFVRLNRNTGLAPSPPRFDINNSSII